MTAWTGRLEDPPLLTGEASYLADALTARASSGPGPPAGRAWERVRVVRSEIAHGTWRATRLSADAPAAIADAVTVLGLDAFAALPRRVPIVWHLGDQTHDHSVVADPHVRYVGQPVGLVIGPDDATLADAADWVEVTIDPLPPIAAVDAALAPDAPVLHDDRPDNVLCTFFAGADLDEVEAALAGADHVVEATLDIGRLAGAPMEGRGLAARVTGGGLLDDGATRLEVVTSTQAPHAVRDALAEVLGRPRRDLRVRALDVGGGFGVKDHPHDDELLVAAAALLTGRALVWTEDRNESLSVTTQARDERHRVRLGLDADGRFVALALDSVRNGGAHFAIFGGGPLFACLGMAPGPYDVGVYGARGRVVATTTVPTAAYRGFGQTQAAYVRERIIDLAAAELGVDPVELRLRNMIPPDAQPWASPAGLVYDNGDYAAGLRAARDMAATWPAAPDDGKLRGVGYCSYVQMAGVGPSTVNALIGLSIGGYETAKVRIDPDGLVELDLGTVPQGQGHATSFARIVADGLGIDRRRVRLRRPDTDRSPYSPYGTAASRSMAVGGAALVRATDDLAGRLRRLAADELEAAEVDIDLVGGEARVRGGGGAVSIERLAERAWRGRALPAGDPPGLDSEVVHDPESCTFSFGTHVCRVAVDPDTGVTTIERYHVVQDCGTVIEPVIVEGQTHGAIAQGAGAALVEEVRFDADANPLTASFASYLVPDAGFLPPVTIEQTVTPSPFTPGGMKGIGEGGTNGAFAAVCNAVAAAAATADPGAAARLTDAPLSPERVWKALRQSRTPQNSTTRR